MFRFFNTFDAISVVMVSFVQTKILEANLQVDMKSESRGHELYLKIEKY